MKKRCPDDEVFADYMENRLSEEERCKLEAHLADCDLCLENFMVGKRLINDMDEFLALDPVPTSVTQGAIQLVQDLNTPLWDSITKKTGNIMNTICSRASDYLGLNESLRSSQPLIAIRGSEKSVSEDFITIKKNFKGINIKIEIRKPSPAQNDMEKNAAVRVSLLQEEKRDIRVTLKKGEKEISSFPMDQGYILFDEILPAHYQLLFTQDGQEIGTYKFEIRESSHGSKQDQSKY